MQPEDRDLDALRDMRTYAFHVQDLSRGKRRIDLGEPMVRFALRYALQVVGEAAGRLSNGFREQHPQIPCRQIIAMRNVIAHQYGEIDLDTLWYVATERVPELLAQIEPLLPDPEPDQSSEA